MNEICYNWRLYLFSRIKGRNVSMIAKIFLIILTVFISLVTIVYAGVGQITDQQLNQMMQQGTRVIDIRRPEEWKQTGVVEGSHLLTFFDKKGNYDMEKWLNNFNHIVDKDQPFVLICRTGNRTGLLSNFLDKKLGYKNVNHAFRGISSWIRTGNKVVVVKP